MGTKRPCETAQDVIDLVRRCTPLYRHIATPGQHQALDILSEYVDLDVVDIPTGSECFTWRIPAAWSVQRAEVRLDDRVLLRVEDHPLTVQPYSTSFTGRVDRDELLRHLVWSEPQPDAYAYKSQLAYQTDIRRDWLLSLPWSVVQTLPEGLYDVDLRTLWTEGTMPIGEATLPGMSPTTILLVAHLCHPGIADDGLSGVATGIRVLRTLAKRPSRRYTYRLLAPPETIGSIGWLWRRRDLLPSLGAGIVLESLGNTAPLAWKRSYPGDTLIDRVARHCAARRGSMEERGFRDKVGNDELVFADPDFAVPMVGLQRWPYPEYHTSNDCADLLQPESLDEAFNFIMEMIDILESDTVPRRRFVGPVHLSRQDLYVDPRHDRRLYIEIWRIMQLLGTGRSVLEIAETIGLDVKVLNDYLDAWRSRGLIEDLSVNTEALFARPRPAWLDRMPWDGKEPP
ncbi:MAG: DUF4910 domain-containing protein [Rhodospirillum sp.]|nr:DUF4910 domain-containing protein [Rhodospirillum sp.]MCF8490779.1 DUF4910 domain-containing protein [Rhodospirillum sp.]MCF8499840.1 DUF4910 domain-containing protein [Rhodospirillum sp.]